MLAVDVNIQGRRAYAHSPVEPAYLLEEPYDEEGPDGNNFNGNATQPVRRFQWWGWLSTIGGYISGNGYVWPFNAPAWQAHLDTQGTRDMTRLNAFMQSIAWYKLVPSGLGGMRTLITAGGSSSSNSDYVAAAATPDGTLLVAYVPPAHSGAITVDMAAMSGPSRARWFDPTTGAYTDITAGAYTLPNTGSHAFTPPGNNGSGYTDWTLVLDMDAAPGAVNYQGLWWNAPADSESGWGINFAHQADTIFASWFTYDVTGRGWWLVMTAQKSAANTYSGALVQTRGPPFNAQPFDPAAVTRTEVGSGTLTFTDANNGTLAYTISGVFPAVSQAKSITREVFGPLPTCAFASQPDLALATNFQDLWWNFPGESESGWGINLNHQGDVIFATWFTYDLDGAPLWLVATARKNGNGTYSGDLIRTAGARFDAFNAADVVRTPVGSATFTFADGNSANFDYTVQLSGMPGPSHQAKTITRQVFAPPGTACQ